LEGLIEKKSVQSTEENLFKKRDSVAKFLIAKGYESELVWQKVKELIM
jgi:regulatory protein